MNKQETQKATKSESESIISKLTNQTTEQYFLRALLLGFSGTGKSISATTSSDRVLFLDFDGRAESVAHFPHVKVIQIKEPDPENPVAWDTAKKVLSQIKTEIRQKIFPFDSIVFDGITMMGRFALNWSLLLDPKRGLGGGAAKQHYLPQMNELSKFILSSLSLPIHIVYTAHLELVEDKTEDSFFILPKTTGKLRTELPGWFNETYLCHKVQKGKEIQYLWTLTGVDKYQFCKTALGHSSSKIQVKLSNPITGFKELLGGKK